MAKRKDSGRKPKRSAKKDNLTDLPLAEPPKRSLRLRFRYEGGEVELVSARPVRMVPPPTDNLGPQEPQAGFCLELCTKRGKVLYRRFGANPIQTSVEVPGDDETQPLHRVALEEPRGEFDVVVPALDDAVRLDLFTDAFTEGYGPAECVASVDLLDLPTPGYGREP